MGQVAIWEVLQSDAFELVGVRSYSESKEGVDVGTLMGIDPVGIKELRSILLEMKNQGTTIFLNS